MAESYFARSLEDLPIWVQAGLEAYYQKDYLPLLTTVTDDVMFIGAGPDVVQGKRALMAACGEDISTPSCRMANACFSVMPLGYSATQDVNGHSGFEPDLALVTGFYDLMSECDRPMLTAAHQRISLLARFEQGVWRAFHIHSSNEWGELVDDEVFPIQTSTQTYEYVKRIIDRAERMPGTVLPRQIRVTSGKEVVSLDVPSILYVRALAKACEVHSADGVVVLPCLLGELESQLGDHHFKRVHRSYLVNGAHVERFDGAALVLDDGECISVPRRKRAEVRSWIMGELGSECAPGGGIPGEDDLQNGEDVEAFHNLPIRS